VLHAQPVWALDVEAVTPRVHQPLETDQRLDIAAVPPADDGHRAQSGQTAQGLSHLLRQDGVLRLGYDRRQCPVVIQEQNRAAAAQTRGDALP
jgi:hypothetical protein